MAKKIRLVAMFVVLFVSPATPCVEHLLAAAQVAGLAEIQALGLDPAVLRQVEGAIGDRRLDPAARVSQRFEATPITDVLAAITRATGLIVRFDQAVPELQAPFTGQLADLSLDAALAKVLTANAMAFTVITPKSVLVYTDTTLNRQRFAEAIRVFRLAKAESSMVVQALATYLRASNSDGIPPRFSAVREPALIYVRATADKMDAIANFISDNDK